MKKYAIIWSLITIILLGIATMVSVKALNKFEADSYVLYEQAEIIQQDFENVYLQDNYAITPKDNAIVIKLTKGACSLELYFTYQKEFTYCQIEAAPFYTNKFVFSFILTALLSVGVSALLAFPCLVIINRLIAKYREKKQAKRRH